MGTLKGQENLENLLLIHVQDKIYQEMIQLLLGGICLIPLKNVNEICSRVTKMHLY
jgi:hypothetical protein